MNFHELKEASIIDLHKYLSNENPNYFGLVPDFSGDLGYCLLLHLLINKCLFTFDFVNPFTWFNTVY